MASNCNILTLIGCIRTTMSLPLLKEESLRVVFSSHGRFLNKGFIMSVFMTLGPFSKQVERAIETKEEELSRVSLKLIGGMEARV